MLPEPLRLLIAAYAADDLSPRQKKSALRLLKHSREARHLLRAIVADSQKLRTMPKQGLGRDFADNVLLRLGDSPNTIRPSVRSAPLPHRQFSRSHVLAACSVAIALGLGAWATVVKLADDGHRGSPIVAETPKPESLVLEAQAGRTDGPNDTLVPQIPPVDPPPPPVSEVVVSLPTKATTTPPTSDVLTAPATPELEAVQVKPPRLTLVLSAHGLDSSEATAKLTNDFSSGESHRIDLFCRDTTRALERFQPAVRDKGVRIATESVAAEVAKRRIRGQAYVLFCEDLTTPEWVAILRHIGAFDRRLEEKKPGDGVYETLALMAISQADQKDLIGLLGTDVVQPVVKSKTTGGVDIHKPLSEGTAQQVVDVLDKNAREKKGTEKAAIVLSASALRATPAVSREIKSFVEGRRERPTGAIAVMLVIRQAN